MTSYPVESPNRRRFEFPRVLATLLHPRQETDRLAEENHPSWLTPMLVLSVTMIVFLVVSGFLKGRAAAMGEVSLPVDWEWWTSEMQNNYMQAMQATQGPVFLYVIPLVLGLIKLWLGWLIVSGLLHLVSTLFGGRGTMGSSQNVVAWAKLPFAVRDILRVVFMAIAGHPIVSPGLSGFATSSFLSQILANLDIFLVWYVLLMIVSVCKADSLPRDKAVAAALIVVIAALLIQAGLGTLSASLGGMMVYRPFF